MQTRNANAKCYREMQTRIAAANMPAARPSAVAPCAGTLVEALPAGAAFVHYMQRQAAPSTRVVTLVPVAESAAVNVTGSRAASSSLVVQPATLRA